MGHNAGHGLALDMIAETPYPQEILT